MSITLRQVRYFVAVAETGKVAAAATSIGISASAITEAIKELEAHLGCPLLTRQHKGVALTYEGYRFLQHSRTILAAVSDATYALSKPHGGSPGGLSGRLTLGTSVTVAGYFLAGPLARFRRMFPHLDVQVVERTRTVNERQLSRGQIDIGVLLVSNLRETDRFATETLVQSRRRLWTAANHPLLARETVTLADIAQEPYIQLLIDEAENTTKSYWGWYDLQPRRVFRTESVEAVRSMVATGAGVTILSDMVYRPWSLEGDRLEAKTLANPIPTMDVGLAWPRGRPLSDAAQAFRDFCRMEFGGAGSSPIAPRAVAV